MAKTTIHSDYIPDNAITSTKIAENSIGAREIATNAITTLYVADGSVSSEKLASNIDIAGTFDVTGATTLDSTLSVSGNITGTLATAAQPNITSVGTLTGLDVTGTISSGAITSSGNVTLSSTAPLLYLTNTTSGTGKAWRFSSASNGKLFITQEGVIDAVTLDHTTGNATFAGAISSGAITSTGAITAKSGGGFYLQPTDAHDTDAWILYQYNDNTLRYNFTGSGADEIIIKYPNATNATTLLIDTENQRLGIGTDSPSAPLQLNTPGNTIDGTYYSTFTINNTGSSTWARLRFDRSGVAKWALSLGTDDKFKISNLFTDGSVANPDDNALVIDGSSNVGIGTDSPNSWASYTDSAATILQVEDSSQRARIVINGGDGAHLDLVDYAGASNDKHMNIAVDSGVLKFGSLNDAGNAFVQNNIMVMDLGTGNVGIGTDDPDSKLHVKTGTAQNDAHGLFKIEQTSTSSGSATNAGITTKNYHGTSQFMQWEEHGLRIGSRILTNSGIGDVVFTAGSDSEKMRITSNGFTKHSNTGTYDTYSGADDSHQFVSDNALHSTLWVTNTNTNYATGMLRLESARTASSAFNFLAATTGNLTDDQFLLRGDGNAYADGSWNGGGADYAEYFEWSDRNTGNEDRRGYTVVLSENKIRKSTSEDNPNNIIGVVSGNPSVIGDSDIGAWKNKYQKDDYGSYIKDENGDRVINDEYDETQDYISREDRQEWDIIGLMGKVRINKGQTVGDRWIKMRDISDTIEEWLIK